MKALIFNLPDGVEIPDGKKVGDSFQAMSTYEILPEGKVELTEIDGESIDGSGDENEDQASAPDDSQASAIPGLFAGGSS